MGVMAGCRLRGCGFDSRIATFFSLVFFLLSVSFPPFPFSSCSLRHFNAQAFFLVVVCFKDHLYSELYCSHLLVTPFRYTLHLQALILHPIHSVIQVHLEISMRDSRMFSLFLFKHILLFVYKHTFLPCGVISTST